ncbi:Methyltransferase-like protein 2 [Zostera marina]|uniref:Methyltransferase-like protein 2 n=1 Tax=Zostera marina TaxID=29655 RepID=A0A0K9NMU7_ZOSMR|nr:Methyltransferase-like protein 2 [Zostera marina]
MDGWSTEAATDVNTSSFINEGIYNLIDNDDFKIVFVDPVRLLSSSYSRFRVSASSYYSRPFHPSRKNSTAGSAKQPCVSSGSKKRKRNSISKTHELNEREKAAEKRHQQAKPLLLKAHSALLGATWLLSSLDSMIKDEDVLEPDEGAAFENDFIQLGNLWKAPLFEISLSHEGQSWFQESSGTCPVERTSIQVFNNIISNDLDNEMEVEFSSNQYILPRKSCFFMSDLRWINSLIPVHSDHGFNLIVIDPPWENASASQKAIYSTLPNRYFLSLPVNQLAHTEGSLVALWVTNREKFRIFVEKELFPAWGVTQITSCYWLKVKTDGSLISEMDLFHHRPYECLLLGYINGKDEYDASTSPLRYPKNGEVIISIPGAYSRKPPILKFLSDYIPGKKPPNCIDLFARELQGGWTSWGNEPLRFQDSRYFINRSGG